MVANLAGVGIFERCAKMQRYLMAEEVKVDPAVGGTALRAPQNAAIKSAGGFKIRDVIGEMERCQHGLYTIVYKSE